MLAFAMMAAVRHRANALPPPKKNEVGPSGGALIRWSAQEIRRAAMRLAQQRIQPAYVIAWSVWRRAHQGAWAKSKPMPRRMNLPAFSPFLYGYRNLVERFFNKLKHFRAVATRYEKHAVNYLALVKLPAARIWMRTYESAESAS